MHEPNNAAEEIFVRHPTRFTAQEKDDFLRTVKAALTKAGYDRGSIREQRFSGAISGKNLVIGDPNAPYTITAHYDTPGRNGFLLRSSKYLGQTGANVLLLAAPLILAAAEVLVLGLFDITAKNSSVPFWVIMTVLIGYLAVLTVPMAIKNRNNKNDNTSGVLGVLACAMAAAQNPELRKKCCFVLFDNEEWGVVGSAHYVRKCRQAKIDTKKTLVINLDCIGVGDTLTTVSTGELSQKACALLEGLEQKGMPTVKKRSVFVFMSDHANFPDALMLCYMQRSSSGALYIPNLHSSRDTQCDVDMVRRLAENIMQTIGEM